VDLGTVLGQLNPDDSNPFLFNITGANISLWLADDTLNVVIDKGGFGSPPSGDNLAINSSRLTLTYDPDAGTPTSSVPDGGSTAALFGLGLLGLWGAGRKLSLAW
jgi:hypothetical protein